MSRALTLGQYGGSMRELAELSPLAFDLPARHRDWHIPFDRLYQLTVGARNDALRQGAYARHIATHATLVALVIEDALMAKSGAHSVSDFMVRDIVCANAEQPVSFARQQMLANSFSCLPMLHQGKWVLVSDEAIAKYLRSPSLVDRATRLGASLQSAVNDESIATEPATVVAPDAEITDVMGKLCGSPLLVCRVGGACELIGILSAFDLL